jgi:hypothetical protein
VTVKPLYGHQQGAVIGYNPHKPGRPSHTYHTYLIANLRLVLEVEVQPGDQTKSRHSLPGLVTLLKRLPNESRPQFVRGDCDWGTDPVMGQLEELDQSYLFKLRKSGNVKKLIHKHHCLGQWTYFNEGWEAKEDQLQLQGWETTRRVVLVRRRLSNESLLGVEIEGEKQQQLVFLDGPEDIRLYEYSVLVTNLQDELVTLIQHYRDRADCENAFDEIKNQWGWGGYTTHDMSSCQLIARIIGLIYNWWSLFVRLANPDKKYEAITSRPLLLSSVGRLTQHGRQKRLIVTSNHGKTETIQATCARLAHFFNTLKTAAPQLSSQACWERILAKAMEAFMPKSHTNDKKLLPAPI